MFMGRRKIKTIIISLCVILLLSTNMVQFRCSVISNDINRISDNGNQNGYYFIYNQGQWDPKLLYVSKTDFGFIGLGLNTIYYIVNNIKNDLITNETLSYNIQITLMETNNIMPKGTVITNKKCNFFIGNDKDKWITNIDAYYNVKYNNIWDNINLCFSFKDGKVKYGFEMNELSNIDNIKMCIDNNINILNRDNILYYSTHYGIVLYEKGLSAFNEKGNSIQIDYSIENAQIGFSSDTINKGNYEIYSIIYSSFIGSGYEDPQDMVVDNEGYAYFTGTTRSWTFPTTPGAYSEDIQGINDGFICKMNYNGTKILISSFIGGSGYDYLNGLDIDDNGFILLTGRSNITDFPFIDGSYRNVKINHSATIIKIDNNLSTLIFTCLIGGSSINEGISIKNDLNNNIFVGGCTRSMDFPYTQYYNQLTNGECGFILSLSPNGNDLLFSVRIGNRSTIITDIDINTVNIFITGYTSQTDFPTTEGVYCNKMMGYKDVFVIKMDFNGTILYSTLIGSSYIDIGYAIKTDELGNAYVTGTTEYGFPITNGCYYDKSGPGFILKFDPFGSKLIFSTLMEGHGYDIDIDSNNNVYVTGKTGPGYQLKCTWGCFMNHSLNQEPFIWDGFILKLNENGTRSEYASYISGSKDDECVALDLDNLQNIFFLGTSGSNDFPISNKSYDRNFDTGYYEYDMFLMKLNISTPPSPPLDLIIRYNSSNLFLFWNKPMNNGGYNITGYHIYRGEINNNITLYSNSGLDLYYCDFNHVKTKIYYYYIKAVNIVGESLPSNIVNSLDNVKPEYGIDKTERKASTGDIFTFKIDVTDNVKVKSVTLNYYFTGDKNKKSSCQILHNNTWVTNIIIPDSLKPISYYFEAIDFQGNIGKTEIKDVTVVDNDKPEYVYCGTDKEPTTGDQLVFYTIVKDNIMIEKVKMNYRIGNGIWIETDTEESDNRWSVKIIIPQDSLDPIQYRFVAEDTSGNKNISETIEDNVKDNDPPILIEDLSKNILTTDDTTIFTIKLKDNIEMKRAWILLDLGIDEIMLDLHNNYEDEYNVEYRMPHKISKVSYKIFASDRFNNTAMFPGKNITFYDNDCPILVEDLTKGPATTGDIYKFEARFDDNIGVNKVIVEYRFGEKETNIMNMLYHENWYCSIIIPDDSIEPLWYDYTVWDRSGLKTETTEKRINVVDNDPPLIENVTYPKQCGTGTMIELSYRCRDNIKTGNQTVLFHFGDGKDIDMIPKERRSTFFFEIMIPSNSLDQLSYNIISRDIFGNINDTVRGKIQIIDIIPPKIEQIKDQRIKKGEWISIPINVSDNIEVENIRIEGALLYMDGNNISGRLNDVGTYHVIIKITDNSSNMANMTFKIEVIKEPFNFFIILMIMMIVGIIGIIIYLRFPKNKGKKRSMDHSNN